jgi:hypothetical protein
MKTFHDNTGRPWRVEIDIGAIKRVREFLPEVDLLAPHSPAVGETRKDRRGRPMPLMTRLMYDDVLLVDTIFVVVKPQADALKVSDLDFAAAIGGKAALEANRAFQAEWADFFRQRGRPAEATALEENAAIVQEESEAQASLVTLAAETMRKKLQTRRLRMAAGLRGDGKTSGKSPASAESAAEKTSTP